MGGWVAQPDRGVAPLPHDLPLNHHNGTHRHLTIGGRLFATTDLDEIFDTLRTDPELRYTQSGSAVANFTLATSENWNNIWQTTSRQRPSASPYHQTITKFMI